jgi:hypothetical protein
MAYLMGLSSAKILVTTMKYKWGILFVVIHECGMWSHTQPEEDEVSVLENRVLEKIFGSTRDK